MSDFKTYEELSRADWGTDELQHHKNWDSIEKGLRIREVKALELMAQDRKKIETDLDYYKRKSKRLSIENNNLYNRINGYKGVITKLKNKLKKS